LVLVQAFFFLQVKKRFQIRRLLGAHLSLRHLLSSVNPLSVATMSYQDLGRLLLLPVRLCIAQYSEEVRTYISRYWVTNGKPIPELVAANAEKFAAIGISVESVTSIAWKKRFTDFSSLLATFSSRTFRSTWLFPRILQTIVTELSLSQIQVSQCLLVLFLHQAQSYGRLWTNECLGGFGAFGCDQDFSSSSSSSLVDAGLLTLAHPKIPNRAVSHKSRLVLLSRSWTSIPRRTPAAPILRRVNEGTAIHPPWSKAFFDGLIWPREFDLAHISNPNPEGNPPKSKSRIHMNVFMTVVSIGLFCRVMHLKALSLSQKRAAFTKLLFEGCVHGDDLFEAELKFLDNMKASDKCLGLTINVTREIMAFYQSGILGLHSCTTVFDKLKSLSDEQFADIKQLFRDGRFQIDQHWLLDSRFMQAYRARSANLEMPTWIGDFVRAHSVNHTRKHMEGINHVPVHWILPRFKDEILEISTSPIPNAIRSFVRPIPEVHEIADADAPSLDEISPDWLDAVPLAEQTSAVPLCVDLVEEDMVVESFERGTQLFGSRDDGEFHKEVFFINHFSIDNMNQSSLEGRRQRARW